MGRHKVFIVLIMLVWVLCDSKVTQAEDISPASDEAALDLLKVFDEQTEIATKSKLNADYVPGMVTVLRGEDLLARGVRTVGDALPLIPGIEITTTSSSKRIIVRGDQASTKIRMMLDSIPMNQNMGGLSITFLEIPVAQVERIEVIRGPGSGLHGEYAYLGTINVITRKEGNQIYGRVESFDSYGGGALYSLADPQHDLKLSINVAGTHADGADVTAGMDALYGMGLGGISNAPGPANEEYRQFSSGMNLEYHDFSLTGYVLNLQAGSLFGGAGALPAPEDDIVSRNTVYGLEAAQKVRLMPGLEMKLNVGWWNERFKQDEDQLLYPQGFPGFPNGVILAPSSKERRIYGGAEWTWKGWQKHSLLLGYSIVWSKLTDSSLTANLVPSTFFPTGSVDIYRGSESWVRAGVDRLLNSVTFQDEYQILDNLALTLGLRYDHYDDVGDRLTPRAAGVWQVSDHHILKAQYAQAFRPPTFFEMFGQNNPVFVGSTDIKPSVIDTYELGYIYKREGTTLRATWYYSDMENLVASGGVFRNTGGSILMGMELEWEQEITSYLKLNSNLTLVETEDRVTNEELPGAASVLANVGVNYRPVNDLMLNMQYRYVGPRHRAVTDPREKLEHYNNVDLTANWFKPFGYRGWTLRGGIRNLFDEDIYYAAPANTYPGDYPRPGIHFWGQLSLEF